MEGKFELLEMLFPSVEEVNVDFVASCDVKTSLEYKEAGSFQFVSM